MISLKKYCKYININTILSEDFLKFPNREFWWVFIPLLKTLKCITFKLILQKHLIEFTEENLLAIFQQKLLQDKFWVENNLHD